MLLNSQWVIEEVKEVIKKKHLEINENKNRLIQKNLSDATTAVLRGKLQ